MDDTTPNELIDSLAHRGHFVLESGHHGDLWLDLELLFLHPRRMESAVVALSELLRPFAVDAVCGPLNEGAFVALMVAARLDAAFSYAERLEPLPDEDLFPVEYRLPPALRATVGGKRVAIVNDVINAGSAVRGTLSDLLDCGATPVALGSLLVLGDAAGHLARDNHMSLISLDHYPNRVWIPSECPLCAAGAKLDPR